MAKNKDRYFEALDMKKRQRAKTNPKAIFGIFLFSFYF